MATELYRRIIILEILADSDPSNATLEDVVYQIDEGDWSGSIISDNTITVEPALMRQLLIAQGTDPDYLVPEDDEED